MRFISLYIYMQQYIQTYQNIHEYIYIYIWYLLACLHFSFVPCCVCVLLFYFGLCWELLPGRASSLFVSGDEIIAQHRGAVDFTGTRLRFGCCASWQMDEHIGAHNALQPAADLLKCSSISLGSCLFLARLPDSHWRWHAAGHWCCSPRRAHIRDVHPNRWLHWAAKIQN